MTDWSGEIRDNETVWERLYQSTKDNVLIIDGSHRGEMIATKLLKFAFRGEEPIYESYKIRLQFDGFSIDLRCASEKDFETTQTAVWFYLVNSEANSVL